MTTDSILHLDFIIKKRISERFIIDGTEIKRIAEIFVSQSQEFGKEVSIWWTGTFDGVVCYVCSKSLTLLQTTKFAVND